MLELLGWHRAIRTKAHSHWPHTTWQVSVLLVVSSSSNFNNALARISRTSEAEAEVPDVVGNNFPAKLLLIIHKAHWVTASSRYYWRRVYKRYRLPMFFRRFIWPSSIGRFELPFQKDSLETCPPSAMECSHSIARRWYHAAQLRRIHFTRL